MSIKVGGDYACFSRPEFKAERASYPWITPSAARSIFEAVLWKPEIRWEIRRIKLLRPVKFTNFRRNEINTKIPPSKAAHGKAELYTDSDRAQRNTLALKDVEYILEADLFLTDKGLAGGENIVKYVEMFQRRLEKGQHFHQPYLGCREFAARVSPPRGDEDAIDENMDAGLMFYDFSVFPGVDKNGKTKGKAVPLFFRANMTNGIIEVQPKSEIERGVS